MKRSKIKSRGSIDVLFADGFGAALWYDHCLGRTWTLQLKNPEGDHIGPSSDGSAEYNHRRQDAVRTLLALAQEHGGIL